MKRRDEGAPEVAGAGQGQEAASGAAWHITRVFAEAIRIPFDEGGEPEAEGVERAEADDRGGDDA